MPYEQAAKLASAFGHKKLQQEAALKAARSALLCTDFERFFELKDAHGLAEEETRQLAAEVVASQRRAGRHLRAQQVEEIILR